MYEDNTALAKLATELTNRVDSLEKENAQLRKQAAVMTEQLALNKQAAAEASTKPIVSDAVAEATVNALFKAGALEKDQLAESKGILMRDAEASHRILQKMLDDGIQVKTAAFDRDENISGGMIAGVSAKKIDAQAECLDRMLHLLQMY